MEVQFGELYEHRLLFRVIGLLYCVTDMDSSSLPGRVSWIDKIKWNLSVSLVYLFKKGRVIIPLFEYISVCYVKQLEWAAGVEIYDLYHIFFQFGGGAVPEEPYVLHTKDFKLWSQIM